MKLRELHRELKQSKLFCCVVHLPDWHGLLKHRCANFPVNVRHILKGIVFDTVSIDVFQSMPFQLLHGHHAEQLVLSPRCMSSDGELGFEVVEIGGIYSR